MAGGKDGQTLFHRILPPTARGLITSTTAVDWHLKVKNKKYNVGLIDNYCITVSMQKISSIYKLIQQILWFHELNDHTHFWAGPPKNHWKKVCFPEFAQTCKKSVHFINSFLRYSQFWNPVTRLATPIQNLFDQILIYVNLYQHAKNQPISLICSGDMVN